MKKPSRFLRVLGVAGLLLSLFAATLAPAVAQTDDDDGGVDIGGFFDFEDAGFRDGNNTIYYPWVANGENFGLGESQTSISVQNLENRDTRISIFVGDGDGGFELETTAFLAAFAAKTFTADQLEIEEGSGAPVAVVSFQIGADDLLFPDVVAGTVLTETVVLLSKPDGVTGDFTQVNACVVNASSATTNPGLGVPVGFVVAADFTFDGVAYSADDDDDTTDENSVFRGSFTQDDLQEILEDANSGGGDLVNPFGGLINDADCNDVRIAGSVGSAGVPGSSTSLDSVAIGGVAKQAVEGDSLPSTTAADTAVSGYNALNGAELSRFGEHYLPIVQTNCGPGGCWNSVVRVANLSNENNAVTIAFFPHDDAAGSLDTGFQVQESVDGGATVNIDLSEYVPEGWVGSAHIQSDGTVFAMVDRYKVGYDMWVTNTSSSASFETDDDGDGIDGNGAQIPNAQGRYVLFAPHVLLDYFGWNTGINVANLVEEDNNVSIQYFNLFGNATQVLNQRIAANGMTYFYDPSQPGQDNNSQDVTSDVNANIVGSALIWSDHPVAAAIDATKYPETDPNGGPDVFQATSYSATANVFTFQAVPLVQKGNPVDGMGDTSGINVMNPNATAATVNVYFVNPSGFNAQNFGTSSVTIPGFANGFVYSMTQRNLPNGFTGAAQVVSNIPVAAVSANVNYAVDGDGSAIFNAFNPCGFFRVSGNCTFGDVFEPGGQSVTKTFVDTEGNPVAGVGFSVESADGATDSPFQRDGFSGIDGSRTFENIPVGVYDLFVTDVPDGFADLDPTVAQDTFTVTEGSDVVLENILEFDQGFTKTVIVAGSGADGDDDGDDIDDDSGVTLTGVDVVVFEQIGDDANGFPVVGDIVFEGQTDANGQVSGVLPSGDYVLCLFDADGIATLGDDDDDDTNNEEVSVDLAAEVDSTFLCDLDIDGDSFTVVDGATTPLLNEVSLLDGVLNVFVFETGLSDTGGVETRTGVAGVQVCAGVECATTGADGFARFEDVSEGGITVTVQGDDNIVVNAFGGDLTVDVSTVTDDGLSGTPATIVVAYSPTEDVAQDGFSDDVIDGTVVGSFDLNVDLGGASDVVIATQLEGVSFDGATVTLFAMVGDGTLCENGVGAEIDSDVSVDGSVTFSGVAEGTYCVAVDFDGDDIDDEIQEITVAADGSANATINLTTGQIDFLNIGITTDRPSEDTLFCLEQVVTAGSVEIGCVYVPQGGFEIEDAFFYADLPSGTYRIVRYQAPGGVRDAVRDTSNDVEYSVTQDLNKDGFLADVENLGGDSTGRGVIRTDGSADFTQLVAQLTPVP